MPCGCGGSSKVYKPHNRDAAKTDSKPVAARGLPAVWNGPKPKTAAQ